MRIYFFSQQSHWWKHQGEKGREKKKKPQFSLVSIPSPPLLTTLRHPSSKKKSLLFAPAIAPPSPYLSPPTIEEKKEKMCENPRCFVLNMPMKKGLKVERTLNVPKKKKKKTGALRSIVCMLKSGCVGIWRWCVILLLLLLLRPPTSLIIPISCRNPAFLSFRPSAWN